MLSMLDTETFEKTMNLYLNCFSLVSYAAFPELKGQVKAKRVEITAIIAKKSKMLQQNLDEAFCRKGLVLVEKYSSKLPPLTGKLSEKELGAYLSLLNTKNPQFVKLWEELVPWADSDEFKKLLQPK